MDRHADRLKSSDPILSGRGVEIYQKVLKLQPEIRKAATQLKISTNAPMNRGGKLIYDEPGARVYFLETGIVYVYFTDDELTAGQVGPLGEIIK